ASRLPADGPVGDATEPTLRPRGDPLVERPEILEEQTLSAPEGHVGGAPRGVPVLAGDAAMAHVLRRLLVGAVEELEAARRRSAGARVPTRARVRPDEAVIGEPEQEFAGAPPVVDVADEIEVVLD